VKQITDCYLYGIVDLGCTAPANVAFTAEKMIEGGVDIIQLRAKNYSEKDVLWFAEEIAPVTRAGGVPFIINDYPEISAEVGAQGTHVGQDDLTPEQARILAGKNAIIGKSTHSYTQAVVARAEGADYIGFGPLFSTPTKPDYKPVGLAEIRRVHELVRIPIFCIGGIKLDNLASVLAAGAKRAVIVSGILKAPDIAAYARDAKAMLEENLKSKI
jgi:thiamine-phosphate pyrophosphorylase